MIIEMSPINFVDLLLRGANLGIMLLVVAHLLRRPEFNALVQTGLLFCITGIIEIVLNSPAMARFLDFPAAITLPLQQLHFLAMWWFVRALFNDRFCWGWHCFWPVAVAVPLVAGASLAPVAIVPGFELALIGLNGVLLILIIHRALRSRAGDLVTERRAFSLALAFSVPPFSLFVFVTELMNLNGPLSDEFCVMSGGVYFLLALGFSFWLTNLKEELFHRNGLSGQPAAHRGELNSADRLELDRVITAMDGGLYLEPGLTIGALSEILTVPEHRLRRLINGGLGYRNFSAFVNDYRIEEAKRRLSNPGLAREQIIQHAFSLGYASLAPFNRAFRERVGVSPTEYREEALGRVAAE